MGWPTMPASIGAAGAEQPVPVITINASCSTSWSEPSAQVTQSRPRRRLISTAAVQPTGTAIKPRVMIEGALPPAATCAGPPEARSRRRKPGRELRAWRAVQRGRKAARPNPNAAHARRARRYAGRGVKRSTPLSLALPPAPPPDRPKVPPPVNRRQGWGWVVRSRAAASVPESRGVVLGRVKAWSPGTSASRKASAVLGVSLVVISALAAVSTYRLSSSIVTARSGVAAADLSQTARYYAAIERMT